MINWKFLRDSSDWREFERMQYESPRNRTYARVGLVLTFGTMGSFIIATIYNNIWMFLLAMIHGSWMGLTYVARSSWSYCKPRSYPCWAARINDEVVSVTAEDIKPILYESEGWK